MKVQPYRYVYGMVLHVALLAELYHAANRRNILH